MTGSLARRLVAECFGTFVLVFAGTCSIVVEQQTGGALGQVGVAMVWGLTVLALIYAIGDSSGCHLNPAVTLGFCADGRFPPREVGSYVASQCLGAILGSLAIALVFPGAVERTITTPSGSAVQSVAMEVFLTLYLMFVILRVSSGSKERGAMAGVAVGGVIAAEVLIGGPVSGASMNPARSLGPALVAGRCELLWIYLVAPLAGAMVAVLVHRCIQSPRHHPPHDPIGDQP